MVSGRRPPGAADLALLRAVFAHQHGAWEQFVRKHKDDVYRPCRLAFMAEDADDVYVDALTQLRANDFELLREFNGSAPLSSFLRLVLREILYPHVARLLTEQPDRAWRAFEHFFKRDIERIIQSQFPGSAETGRHRDLYNDVASALIENDYRRLQGYKGQGSFGGYVLRIVKNLCIDLFRKDVPRRRLPAAIGRLPELEQEVFRQLYWERCRPEQLLAAVRAKGLAVAEPQAIAAATAAVQAALPANFKAGGSDDERPTVVPLPTDTDGSPIELPHEGPTPEEEVITRQNEAARDRQLARLRTVIARQTPDIRLYLTHLLTDPPPAPRDIARLMGRPVSEIYSLSQQAQRALRQDFWDDPS